MKKRERVFKQYISIYVLSLENGYYYVGQSINVEKRLEEHRQRKGANFTKLHPVLSLVEVFKTETKKMIIGELYEDFFVMKYIKEYGAEKVKGGTFLGSSRKIQSKFDFYSNWFEEAQQSQNPPRYFLEKVSSRKLLSNPN